MMTEPQPRRCDGTLGRTPFGLPIPVFPGDASKNLARMYPSHRRMPADFKGQSGPPPPPAAGVPARTMPAVELADEPVCIVRADPDWPRRFEEERALLEATIGEWAVGGIRKPSA